MKSTDLRKLAAQHKKLHQAWSTIFGMKKGLDIDERNSMLSGLEMVMNRIEKRFEIEVAEVGR